jgi:hypothetical protein
MTSTDPLPPDPGARPAELGPPARLRLERFRATAVFHVPVVPLGAAGTPDSGQSEPTLGGEPVLLFLELGSRNVSALKQEFFRLYEAEMRPRLEARSARGTRSPVQLADLGRAASERLPESVRAPLSEFLHANPAWLEHDFLLVLLNWDALTMVQPAESRAVPAQSLLDAVRRFHLHPRLGDTADDERYGRERGLEIVHVPRPRRTRHGA